MLLLLVPLASVPSLPSSHESLLAWLKSRGGKVRNVAVAVTPIDGLRGLVATDAVAIGDVLLAIDSKVIAASTTAAEAAAQIGKRKGRITLEFEKPCIGPPASASALPVGVQL